MTELNYREAYLRLFNHISDLIVALEDILKEAEEIATATPEQTES